MCEMVWCEIGKMKLLEEALLTLFAGQSRDTFLATLQHLGGRCSIKWEGAHTAYRCKTCAATDSSCICVECFNASDHEGHDYSFYSARTGGCCDCGDPDAWDMKGSCPEHVSIVEDPLEMLSPELIHSASRELTTVVHEFSHAIHNILEQPRGTKDLPLVESIRAIILFLSDVSGWNEGFRRLVSSFVVPILPRILQLGLRHDLKMLSYISAFILGLMFDREFKREFAFCFVPNFYHNYLSELLNLEMKDFNDASASVGHFFDKVNVQFFTIKSLVMTMLTEYELGTIMQNAADDLFSRVSVPQENGRLKLGRVMMRKQNISALSHLLNDFHIVFSHDTAAAWAAENDVFLERFYDFAKLMHGMYEHKRIVSGAAVNDSDEIHSWSRFVIYEHHIVTVHSLILKPISEERLMRRMARSCLGALMNLLSDEGKIEASAQDPEFDDLTQEPLSLHCPLHRLLASILLCFDDPIDVLKSLQKEVCPEFDLSTFMEIIGEDLICVVVKAFQSRRGMWVRNGIGLYRAALTYFSSGWRHYSFELDICLLRMYSQISDNFFSRIIHRLGISNWLQTYLNVNNDEEFDQQQYGLLSDTIIMIICILEEKCGYERINEERVRREIANWLMIEDLTFSELCGFTVSDINDHPAFESILKEMSIYRQPKAHQQGRFVLKKSFFDLYDPCFIFFSVSLREKSFEKFLLSNESFRPWKPDQVAEEALRSSLLFSIVYSILHNYSQRSDFFFDSMTLLHQILRILEMMISVESETVLLDEKVTTVPELDFHLSFDTIASLIDPIEGFVQRTVSSFSEGHPSMLEILVELTSLDKFKQLKPVFHSLLGQISTRVNDKEALHRIIPINTIKKLDDIVEMIGDDEELKREKQRTRRKMKAKKRQKALMDKFAKQRSKFEEKFGGIHEEEKDYDDLSQGACSICGSSDSELCLICYATRTDNVNRCNRWYDVADEQHPFFYWISEDSSSNGTSIRSGENVVMRTCGHLVHRNCHKNYLRSNEDELGFQGEDLFKCMLCRRNGNCLVRYTPTNESFIRKISDEEFGLWIARLSALDYVPEKECSTIVHQEVEGTLSMLMSEPDAILRRLKALESTIIMNELRGRLLTTSQKIIPLTDHPLFGHPWMLRQAQLLQSLNSLIENADHNDERPLLSALLKPRESRDDVFQLFPIEILLRCGDVDWEYRIRLVYLLNIATIWYNIVEWVVCLVCTREDAFEKFVTKIPKQESMDITHSIQNLAFREPSNLLNENMMLDVFMPTLKHYMLPMLRQCSTYAVHVLHVNIPEDLILDITDEQQEYDALISLLGLRSPVDILTNPLDHERHLICTWSSFFKEMTVLRGRKTSGRTIPHTDPLTFIELPNSYHTLLSNNLRHVCRSCFMVPRIPGLCLLCGQLICISSRCCKSGSMDECVTVWFAIVRLFDKKM